MSAADETYTEEQRRRDEAALSAPLGMQRDLPARRPSFLDQLAQRAAGLPDESPYASGGLGALSGLTEGDTPLGALQEAGVEIEGQTSTEPTEVAETPEAVEPHSEPEAEPEEEAEEEDASEQVGDQPESDDEPFEDQGDEPDADVSSGEPQSVDPFMAMLAGSDIPRVVVDDEGKALSSTPAPSSESSTASSTSSGSEQEASSESPPDETPDSVEETPDEEFDEDAEIDYDIVGHEHEAEVVTNDEHAGHETVQETPVAAGQPSSSVAVTQGLVPASAPSIDSSQTAAPRKRGAKAGKATKTRRADKEQAKISSVAGRTAKIAVTLPEGENAVTLRGLPQALVERLRALLMSVTTSDDANSVSYQRLVMCYILAMTGMPADDYDDETARVVALFQQATPVIESLQGVQSRLAAQEKMLKTIDDRSKILGQMVMSIELGASYLLAESTGALDTYRTTPENLKVSESRVLGLRNRVRQQTQTVRKVEMAREGRSLAQ